MHLSELKSQHVSELLEMANGLEIENANRLRKQELMFAILKKRAKTGETIYGDGTLEVLPDGFGFLRSPETSYLASTDDIYISPSQIRRFNLHTGDTIEGHRRASSDQASISPGTSLRCAMKCAGYRCDRKKCCAILPRHSSPRETREKTIASIADVHD